MLLTFGHGTATAERMTEFAPRAGVTALIDVRIAPGSRRHPHVARAELERWLPEAGVSYRWDSRLGGLRWPARTRRTSRGARTCSGVRRAHADRRFPGRGGRGARRGPDRPTAVMCAESLWWRCHRRLLADFVTAARGEPVRHLLHDGRTEEHRIPRHAAPRRRPARLRRGPADPVVTRAAKVNLGISTTHRWSAMAARLHRLPRRRGRGTRCGTNSTTAARSPTAPPPACACATTACSSTTPARPLFFSRPSFGR